ncbi:hypothetical protein JKP88DRAFT_253152 [Tribonema minus]|uniref:Uncharacterized protein n=1 Tax=Tribonema minus TaxID=303371 RepID=A0A836CJK5_9STRA|nr:hypothetical protein JKP88DRAFT_253152 [Tribonema minus]
MPCRAYQLLHILKTDSTDGTMFRDIVIVLLTWRFFAAAPTATGFVAATTKAASVHSTVSIRWGDVDRYDVIRCTEQVPGTLLQRSIEVKWTLSPLVDALHGICVTFGHWSGCQAIQRRWLWWNCNMRTCIPNLVVAKSASSFTTCQSYHMAATVNQKTPQVADSCSAPALMQVLLSTRWLAKLATTVLGAVFIILTVYSRTSATSFQGDDEGTVDQFGNCNLEVILHKEDGVQSGPASAKAGGSALQALAMALASSQNSQDLDSGDGIRRCDVSGLKCLLRHFATSKPGKIASQAVNDDGNATMAQAACKQVPAISALPAVQVDQATQTDPAPYEDITRRQQFCSSAIAHIRTTWMIMDNIFKRLDQWSLQQSTQLTADQRDEVYQSAHKICSQLHEAFSSRGDLQNAEPWLQAEIQQTRKKFFALFGLLSIHWHRANVRVWNICGVFEKLDRLDSKLPQLYHQARRLYKQETVTDDDQLQRVHREIGAEPATVADGTPAAQERLHALDHVVVTGVDPGQVLAFSAVTALGQRWRRKNAADFAANPPPEGEGVTAQEVSGADYRVWALSVRNEQGEAQRRGANQAYSDALAALADRHTRTGRYQVLRAYCTTWGHHADAMWGELLHPARRHQRFSRFRAQQAAIAKMAEKLAPIRLQHRPPGWKHVRSRGRRYPRRRRRHKRWRDTHRRPRRIIFFGACAHFPSRGRASIPIKKLVAQLACRCPTLMTPQPYSSASCLVCGQPTRGGGDEFGHRNRVCRNQNCALAQAAEGGVAVIDRDTNARANLGMRGVYATCGVDDIIPGYVPADQEEEEESDEEGDDEEDGDEEDGEEGGNGDEGGDGGGGPVDDGEGGGDEEEVDDEGDAIMV